MIRLAMLILAQLTTTASSGLVPSPPNVDGFAATAFGFGIELVQAPIPWRSFAWTDAALNAAGAVVGAVTGAVAGPVAARTSTR